MQELNDKDLEQVNGGTTSGVTGGSANGYGSTNGYYWYGSGSSNGNSNSTSTIQPNLIQSSANGNGSAWGGSNNYAGSGASTFSAGTIN